MLFLLILSLVSLSFCQYKQLKKHSSVSVSPNTKVYLDLSSFDTGELISFEIKMDLFHGSVPKYYEFQIDQVPASSYYEGSYWSTLRQVKNANVSCTIDRDCRYKWEEIKKEGNKYIYIIPSEPFIGYYSFWGNKIKIINTGGKISAGAIVAIVFAVVVIIAIFIVIIAVCCCHCSCRNGYGGCCCCCRTTYYGATTIQANIPYQQPVYPAPVPVSVPAPVAVSPVYPVPGPVYPQAQLFTQLYLFMYN